MPAVGSPLWRRGFRPFFLAAGLYGALAAAAWTAIWLGALSAPRWLAPTGWHAHEMIFGLVAAAIAGFLLTSVPVWTGRPALRGRALVSLLALWAAGRIAMLAAGVLPAAAVAALDAPFLPALAAVLARTLRGTRQRANQAVVAVVVLLALANLALHAHALGLPAPPAPRVLRVAVGFVVLLIVVIGGRITPAFTRNAFARRGVDAPLRSRPWLDRTAIAAVALWVAAEALLSRSVASGVAAGVAGVAVAARLAGWQGLRTRADPLLWSLHAGLAWVALGLLLVAGADLGAPLPATAGLHALTTGAMGSMILAVMTRVALGHTGRPLVLPPGAVGCYALVHAGAATRVAAALAPGAAHLALLVVAGALWSAAFALFALLYAPILVGPRVDGADG